MTSSGQGSTTPGTRIEIRNLTKHFGSVVAVDNLTFDVEPGRITGFLGPNGAGKTTTLRMALGLVRPTGGTALIGGVPYRRIARPLRVVGSALEATNFHPGRSGRDHLRVLGDTAGIGAARVDELLDLVGLKDAARKRAGGYSMGMRQRLGLAAALIGDPPVLLLDEPTNGLDPEGIRWLRGFLRHLSSQGRTILISSHLLSEVEQTVDDVVIINRGRLVKAGPIEELHGEATCLVRTSEPTRLAQALFATAGIRSRPAGDGDAGHLGDGVAGGYAGGIVEGAADGLADGAGHRHPDGGGGRGGALVASTADLRLVGDIALQAGLPIWELRAQGGDLEQLFFALTEEPSGAAATTGPPPSGVGADGAGAEQTGAVA